ncbi:hypothetical protein, partial [Acinetobacter baumannii]|uniref:hypothetical protein n=1 Tax=Acinetobacter baumannii TaxID=470 RepID=UPI000A943828
KEKEIHWEDLKRLIQEKSETLSPMLEEKMGKERQLLENIHQRKSEIMSLYEKGKQIRDDGVYRYYHHSAKVYF